MTALKGVATLFLETNKIDSDVEVNNLLSKLRGIVAREGNNNCADCESENPVTCFSLNLGLFLCSDCEEVHKEVLKPHYSCLLPVDQSRVETLDAWIRHSGSNALLRFLQQNGNIRGNSFWEKKLKKESIEEVDKGFFSAEMGIFVKPEHGAEMAVRKFWIEAKYLKGSFCDSFEREIVIKLKGKISRVLTVFEGTDLCLEMVDTPGKRARMDTFSLPTMSIRPYKENPGGEIDWFEVQNKLHQFVVLECSDTTLLLFTMHRCGCMLFPPKVCAKPSGTVSCCF